MTPEQRKLADEGIERLEAAILRGVERGLTVKESVRVHMDALAVLHPAANALIMVRIVEKMSEEA